MKSTSSQFSVSAAYRMYVGPPERTLLDVAEACGCHVQTLSTRLKAAGLEIRAARKQRVRALPAEVDPAVRQLLEIVISRRLPWAWFGDHVRTWMYRPPTGHGPPIGALRRELQQIGLDLAVVPYRDDAETGRVVVPAFASGRTYA